MKSDYKIISFKTTNAWREWLVNNASSIDGIWVQLFKKTSGIQSVTYAEALDEALCFGWIDGQKKSYDGYSYLQKFTPRRKKSLWSKRNREYVERLDKAERMMPSGIKEVEQAKEDGRWDAAYDKPSEMVVPEDFLVELHKFLEAEKFFGTLNKSNRYAIAWRLQTAKTEETKLRRRAKLLEMLKSEQKLY
jgi:uncharacterized protein YdeI (YjbR/CyaY-like superfamily)